MVDPLRPRDPPRPGLFIVADPDHTWLARVADLADPKDLPLLAVALRERCPWLVSFNLRDYQPGHPAITVLRPGDFVTLIRRQFTQL